MLLQEFLRTSGSLAIELLAEKYAVKARRHPGYPNLVQFKYSQIDSPMGEPLVQECRGVILDEANGWAIAARPFDKFFNYGEGHAAEIDWTTARVQEKVDGSLMILYFYDKTWHVASSGTPDAGGACNDFGFTFNRLFWNTFGNLKVPPRALDNFTFMFELTSQYNRVIVKHEEPRLTLIGIRHKDGTEYPVTSWLNPGFPIVKEYPLTSMREVLETFETFQPTSQEGYVIVDKFFNRIKIKHPGYVALHHLKDGFGTRRIVEIVRQGETSEVIANFPEYTKEFEDIRARYDALCSEIDMDYERLWLKWGRFEGTGYQRIGTQKDFALDAVKTKCPGALFAMRAGHVGSVRQFFKDKFTIENLMRLLGLRDADISLRE